MGLLTDPGIERSRIPAVLNKYHMMIGCFLYIIGFAWCLLLAYNPFNHGTYFSENALLPGLVQGEFVGEKRAHHFLNSLRAEEEKHSTDMPHAWIAAQFTQLGLDTHIHNFSLENPLAKEQVFRGKNVYGILRAPRSSSTEALVVCAPYRPRSSVLEHTGTSVALILAMAEFFTTQIYWAKDIIFLVTENEQLGIQAWLEAYHRTNCGWGYLQYGDLPARSGPIQAAINLELYTPFVSHIDVKIEGLNGQLPNLDLFNLVHRLCHREGLAHTFKHRSEPYNHDSVEGWLYQLKTLALMVSTQAAGVPNGNHGAFHRFGIASVSLEGTKVEGSWQKPGSFLRLGRILEGICRSLNNLLEKFHQSFFFYLLPSSNRYISIGVYMPAFGVLGSGLLVLGLALWYSTGCAADEQEKQGMQLVDYSLLSCLPHKILMHLLALLLVVSPRTAALIGKNFGFPADTSVFVAISGFSAAVLVLPLCLNGLSKHLSWEVLKCMTVLELAILVFVGSVYNISAAFIVTAIYTPLSYIVKPTGTRVAKTLRAASLLLCHPLVLLFIFVAFDTYVTFGSLAFDAFLWKCFVATKRAVTYSIVDSFIYGNWIFDAVVLWLLPIWLLLWTILFFPPSPNQTS